MISRHPYGRLAAALALTVVLLAAGLIAGSDGWSWPSGGSQEQQLIVWQIRAPRSLGAWMVGTLLGMAGAIAQGLFRNPLAEPYLLGAAPGATLAVVLMLAVASAAGSLGAAAPLLAGVGLVPAAFVGALFGVSCTLLMARGSTHTTMLLLSGVVVGFLLGALADLVTLSVPEALRGKQSFLLGNTAFLGWPACASLAWGLAATLVLAVPLSRGLDALALGDESAASLGVPVALLRLLLVGVLALATAVAVAQAGLVSFVGLVAPHLARRTFGARHAVLIPAAALAGGGLLLGADLLARTVVAPQEWPVGILTAVLGGLYLLVLLHRRRP